MKRRQILTGFISLPLIASGGQISSSTANCNSEIVKSLTIDQLDAILREIGFITTKMQSEDKTPMLTFRAQGFKVAAWMQDSGTTLMLYCGFTDMHPPLDKINEWNMNYRFCRAMLDSDKEATLISDLNIQHGVTKEALEGLVTSFADNVSRWASYCEQNTANSGAK
jgi:hypothetical protein